MVAPLLLASASPRRRDLLESAGVSLMVRAVTVDETVCAGEEPDAYLERVTAAKLGAAQALPEAREAAAILVADTVVVIGGRILGKPADDGEARAMLSELSGAWHRVATRFIVAAPSASIQETVATEVEFRALDAARIDAYVAGGEGRDKAGAYGIQGVGAMLVRRVNGSYTNVMGLPLCEVTLALERLGLR